MYKLISINTDVNHKVKTAAGGSEQCQVEKKTKRATSNIICPAASTHTHTHREMVIYSSQHAETFAVSDGFE